MTKIWWKEAVIYQIYPMSFYDTNGDGIGDLKGILKKLDYLKDLGVDVIWLNPIYKSPNADNGYDISNYYDINDQYGTLADFEKLLDEVHKRSMKLIMDLVIVYTSDEHPWFIESKSSKNNPKRNYYLWMAGKNGKEPNNWESYFHEGSIWQYDERTNEYYFHLFTKKQPDLNWRNPDVKEEAIRLMKWWLDKGIDGFRMDVINRLLKKEGFPDSTKPPTSKKGYVHDKEMAANQPGIHEIIREMNERVLSKYDIMTVGETNNVTPEIALDYVKEERQELDSLFHFEVVNPPKFDLMQFKEIQKRWYKVIEQNGWNSQYLNNHDQPRQVSKFGNDGEYRIESAKLLGTILHTLPGSPYVYQGEEIGMTNVNFPAIDYYNDVFTRGSYNKMVQEGMSPEEALADVREWSRDNTRTPMQWDDSENSGFTSGKPWLGLNPNYREINVKQALKDPDSIFHYYKKLIRLRKENLVMVYGDYRPLMEDHKEIMAYLRRYEKKTWLVVANFSCNMPIFKLPKDVAYIGKKLIISNIKADGNEDIRSIKLKPYETRVYELS